MNISVDVDKFFKTQPRYKREAMAGGWFPLIFIPYVVAFFGWGGEGVVGILRVRIQ
jgi:hypothetical protein